MSTTSTTTTTTTSPNQGATRVSEPPVSWRKGRREIFTRSSGERKRQRPRPRESVPNNTGCPFGMAHIDVHVRIPKHSSILSHSCVCERPLYQQQASELQFTSDRTTNRSFLPSTALNLELRCHHPGVLWRGLLPMLFAPLEDHINGAATDEDKTVNLEEDGIDCCGNNEKDAQFASNPERNRCTTSMTLPWQTLLGLGLVDALTRQHKMMAHHRRSQVSTTGDHPEEDLTDIDRTKKDLFYERRLRLPLELLPQSNSNISIKTDDGDKKDVDDRSSGTSISISDFSVVVWIFPPLQPPSDIDRTPFAGIVSRIQQKASIQNGWNAWLSTLGGGYFGIKSLQMSLWLARQQRNLAIWLGDAKMARQCTVNEAYNWMYSGRFKLAQSLLDNLETEVVRTRGVSAVLFSSSKYNNTYYTTDDKKILQQCSVARVSLQRLKKLSQTGLEKYHHAKHKRQTTISLRSRTKDDFQRVRIVSCS